MFHCRTSENYTGTVTGATWKVKLNQRRSILVGQSRPIKGVLSRSRVQEANKGMSNGVTQLLTQNFACKLGAVS